VLKYELPSTKLHIEYIHSPTLIVLCHTSTTRWRKDTHNFDRSESHFLLASRCRKFRCGWGVDSRWLRARNRYVKMSAHLQRYLAGLFASSFILNEGYISWIRVRGTWDR